MAASHLENVLMQRRRECGLSQQELAQRAGVSRQTINALERGRYEPRLALALRLAGELSCHVDELFWLPEQTAGGRRWRVDP